ncbi:MAG: hypothetical protein AAFO82_24405 [Bacteroidota bacterium]
MTQAYIWATYCRPCIEKLGKVIQDSKEAEVALVLISNDYEIDKIQALLSKNNYIGKTYILSSSIYGSNTRKKLKTFHNELTNDFIHVSAYPQIYILDRNANVLNYKAGSTNITELLKLVP